MFEKLQELATAIEEGVNENSSTFSEEFIRVMKQCLDVTGNTLEGRLMVYTWFINLYKQHRAELDNSENVTNMTKILFQGCARLVLDQEFPMLADSEALLRFLEVVADACNVLRNIGHHHRFVMLQFLCLRPWNHPILLPMITGEPVDHDEAMQYLDLGEFPELFHLRVQILRQKGCNDMALNLCNWCTQHEKFRDDTFIRGNQLVLLYEAGHKAIVWEEMPMATKQSKAGASAPAARPEKDFHSSPGWTALPSPQPETIIPSDPDGETDHECLRLSCCIGKEIVHCLHAEDTHQEATLELAQTFVVQDWLRPRKYCCTKELLHHWLSVRRQVDIEDSEFLFNVGKLLEIASSSWQLMALISAMHLLFGNEFMQFYMEVCVLTLITNKHNLVLAQQRGDSEEATINNQLSFICSVISCLGTDYCLSLRKLGMLTALSLDPQVDVYKAIQKLLTLTPEDHDVYEEGAMEEEIAAEEKIVTKQSKKESRRSCQYFKIPGVSQKTTRTIISLLYSVKRSSLDPKLSHVDLNQRCLKLLSDVGVLPRSDIEIHQGMHTKHIDSPKNGDLNSLQKNGLIDKADMLGEPPQKKDKIKSLKEYRPKAIWKPTSGEGSDQNNDGTCNLDRGEPTMLEVMTDMSATAPASAAPKSIHKTQIHSSLPEVIQQVQERVAEKAALAQKDFVKASSQQPLQASACAPVKAAPGSSQKCQTQPASVQVQAQTMSALTVRVPPTPAQSVKRSTFGGTLVLNASSLESFIRSAKNIPLAAESEAVIAAHSSLQPVVVCHQLPQNLYMDKIASVPSCQVTADKSLAGKQDIAAAGTSAAPINEVLSQPAVTLTTQSVLQKQQVMQEVLQKEQQHALQQHTLQQQQQQILLKQQQPVLNAMPQHPQQLPQVQRSTAVKRLPTALDLTTAKPHKIRMLNSGKVFRLLGQSSTQSVTTTPQFGKQNTLLERPTQVTTQQTLKPQPVLGGQLAVNSQQPVLQVPQVQSPSQPKTTATILTPDCRFANPQGIQKQVMGESSLLKSTVSHIAPETQTQPISPSIQINAAEIDSILQGYLNTSGQTVAHVTDPNRKFFRTRTMTVDHVTLRDMLIQRGFQPEEAPQLSVPSNLSGDTQTALVSCAPKPLVPVESGASLFRPEGTRQVDQCKDRNIFTAITPTGSPIAKLLEPTVHGNTGALNTDHSLLTSHSTSLQSEVNSKVTSGSEIPCELLQQVMVTSVTTANTQVPNEQVVSSVNSHGDVPCKTMIATLQQPTGTCVSETVSIRHVSDETSGVANRVSSISKCRTPADEQLMGITNVFENQSEAIVSVENQTMSQCVVSSPQSAIHLNVPQVSVHQSLVSLSESPEIVRSPSHLLVSSPPQALPVPTEMSESPILMKQVVPASDSETEEVHNPPQLTSAMQALPVTLSSPTEYADTPPILYDTQGNMLCESTASVPLIPVLTVCTVACDQTISEQTTPSASGENESTQDNSAAASGKAEGKPTKPEPVLQPQKDAVTSHADDLGENFNLGSDVDPTIGLKFSEESGDELCQIPEPTNNNQIDTGYIHVEAAPIGSYAGEEYTISQPSEMMPGDVLMTGDDELVQGKHAGSAEPCALHHTEVVNRRMLEPNRWVQQMANSSVSIEPEKVTPTGSSGADGNVHHVQSYALSEDNAVSVMVTEEEEHIEEVISTATIDAPASAQVQILPIDEVIEGGNAENTEIQSDKEALSTPSAKDLCQDCDIDSKEGPSVDHLPQSGFAEDQCVQCEMKNYVEETSGILEMDPDEEEIPIPSTETISAVSPMFSSDNHATQTGDIQSGCNSYAELCKSDMKEVSTDKTDYSENKVVCFQVAASPVDMEVSQNVEESSGDLEIDPDEEELPIPSTETISAISPLSSSDNHATETGDIQSGCNSYAELCKSDMKEVSTDKTDYSENKVVCFQVAASPVNMEGSQNVEETSGGLEMGPDEEELPIPSTETISAVSPMASLDNHATQTGDIQSGCNSYAEICKSDMKEVSTDKTDYSENKVVCFQVAAPPVHMEGSQNDGLCNIIQGQDLEVAGPAPNMAESQHVDNNNDGADALCHSIQEQTPMQEEVSTKLAMSPQNVTSTKCHEVELPISVEGKVKSIPADRIVTDNTLCEQQETINLSNTDSSNKNPDVISEATTPAQGDAFFENIEAQSEVGREVYNNMLNDTDNANESAVSIDDAKISDVPTEEGLEAVNEVAKVIEVPKPKEETALLKLVDYTDSEDTSDVNSDISYLSEPSKSSVLLVTKRNKHINDVMQKEERPVLFDLDEDFSQTSPDVDNPCETSAEVFVADGESCLDVVNEETESQSMIHASTQTDEEEEAVNNDMNSPIHAIAETEIEMQELADDVLESCEERIVDADKDSTLNEAGNDCSGGNFPKCEDGILSNINHQALTTSSTDIEDDQSNELCETNESNAEDEVFCCVADDDGDRCKMETNTMCESSVCVDSNINSPSIKPAESTSAVCTENLNPSQTNTIEKIVSKQGIMSPKFLSAERQTAMPKSSEVRSLPSPTPIFSQKASPKENSPTGHWNGYKWVYNHKKKAPPVAFKGNHTHSPGPKVRHATQQVRNASASPRAKVVTVSPRPRILPRTGTTNYIVKIGPDKVTVRPSIILKETKEEVNSLKTQERVEVKEAKSVDMAKAAQQMIKSLQNGQKSKKNLEETKKENDKAHVITHENITGSIAIEELTTVEEQGENTMQIGRKRKLSAEQQPVRKSSRPTTQMDSTASAFLQKISRSKSSKRSDIPESETVETLNGVEEKTKSPKSSQGNPVLSVSCRQDTDKKVRYEHSSQSEDSSTDASQDEGPSKRSSSCLKRIMNSPGYIPEAVERKTRFGFLRHPEREEEAEKKRAAASARRLLEDSVKHAASNESSNPKGSDIKKEMLDNAIEKKTNSPAPSTSRSFQHAYTSWYQTKTPKEESKHEISSSVDNLSRCNCHKMLSKYKCWNPNCSRSAQVVNSPPISQSKSTMPVHLKHKLKPSTKPMPVLQMQSDIKITPTAFKSKSPVTGTRVIDIRKITETFSRKQHCNTKMGTLIITPTKVHTKTKPITYERTFDEINDEPPTLSPIKPLTTMRITADKTEIVTESVKKESVPRKRQSEYERDGNSPVRKSCYISSGASRSVSKTNYQSSNKTSWSGTEKSHVKDPNDTVIKDSHMSKDVQRSGHQRSSQHGRKEESKGASKSSPSEKNVDSKHSTKSYYHDDRRVPRESMKSYQRDSHEVSRNTLKKYHCDSRDDPSRSTSKDYRRNDLTKCGSKSYRRDDREDSRVSSSWSSHIKREERHHHTDRVEARVTPKRSHHDSSKDRAPEQSRKSHCGEKEHLENISSKWIPKVTACDQMDKLKCTYKQSFQTSRDVSKGGANTKNVYDYKDRHSSMTEKSPYDQVKSKLSNRSAHHESGGSTSKHCMSDCAAKPHDTNQPLSDVSDVEDLSFAKLTDDWTTGKISTKMDRYAHIKTYSRAPRQSKS